MATKPIPHGSLRDSGQVAVTIVVLGLFLLSCAHLGAQEYSAESLSSEARQDYNRRKLTIETQSGVQFTTYSTANMQGRATSSAVSASAVGRSTSRANVVTNYRLYRGFTEIGLADFLRVAGYEHEAAVVLERYEYQRQHRMWANIWGFGGTGLGLSLVAVAAALEDSPNADSANAWGITGGIIMGLAIIPTTYHTVRLKNAPSWRIPVEQLYVVADEYNRQLLDELHQD